MNEVVHTSPTIGSNVEEVVWKNVHFIMWDLGGQESLRAAWNTYYSNTEVSCILTLKLDDLQGRTWHIKITTITKKSKSYLLLQCYSGPFNDKKRSKNAYYCPHSHWMSPKRSKSLKSTNQARTKTGVGGWDLKSTRVSRAAVVAWQRPKAALCEARRDKQHGYVTSLTLAELPLYSQRL